MKHFLLSFNLALAALAAGAQSHNPFAEDTWVKVDIDTTGIYELSYSRLRSLGFEHPERVGVYGYGAVAAADNSLSGVPQQPCAAPATHHGERLLFYGEGPLRASLEVAATGLADAEVTVSPYCTKATYYLSDALPPAQLPQFAGDGGNAEAADWHYCIDLIEREEQNPCLGGTTFHGRELKAGDSEVLSFAIDNYAAGALVQAAVHIKAATKVSERTSLPVTASGVSDNSLTTLPCLSLKSKTRVYSAADGKGKFTPQAANCTVSYTVNIPAGYEGTYAAVDRAYVVYPRKNDFGGRSEMFVNVESGTTSKIANAPRDLTVWDVTNPAAARRVATHHARGEATFTAGNKGGAPLRLVLFDPAASHRSPVTGAKVEFARPDTEAPQMIIVTTPSLRQAAEELAQVHRSRQAMEVLVMEQQEIFDLYSYGMPSAPAVRRMVRHYADTPGALKYLLFYGPTSYDNRGIAVKGEKLVCYQCQNPEHIRDNSTNYASDAYFGILEDVPVDKLPYTRGSVAVGRLPVLDRGMAGNANQKIERYLDEGQIAPYRQRVLKFSDDGDGAAHFTNSELFIETLTKKIPALTVTRADNSLYPWSESGKGEEALRRIEQALMRGQGLVFYSGHGDATSVCKEIDFNVNIADGLRNSTLPLFFFSTCDNFPFDRESHNLSQSVVLNENGGGIGSIGACRTVFLDYNHQLAMAIAKQYASLAPGMSGADILMNARNNVIDKGAMQGQCVNMMCYNYCGDPAVPLPAQYAHIGLEPVDGPIVAGKELKLEGSVADKHFDGTALIEFYDVPKPASTILRAKDDGKEQTVALDQMLLAQFPAQIAGGKFKTSVMLPPNNGASGTGRMVVTAIDSRTGRRAAGELSDIAFAETTATGGNSPASSANIEEFYIDPADYSDGHLVNSVFRVHAIVRTGAQGLALGTSTVGNACRLVLDGKESYPDVLRSITYDEHGNAILGCRLGPVSPGRHTLTLTAVDNLGGAAENTITFFVGTSTTEGRLSVADEPCRTEALFSLDEATATQGRLVVANIEGGTVLSRDISSFPYSWNLVGSDGTTVADGHYRAWIIFPDKKSTPIAEFTVIK